MEGARTSTMDLYAITRTSIETLAHERNARGFIWIVVPEEGQAFGGFSRSLVQYGPALMLDVERAAARPLVVWNEGSLLPSADVLGQVKHVELHPLVAALIVGVNKFNKYKIPRSQATAANIPDWFPLPFDKYKLRAQSFDLPELYAVLDAIFAHIRHDPAKIAALRTDADVHFFKNHTSMFARAAIHAYFDFLASEPPRVNTPLSRAGVAPPSPAARRRGIPLTASFNPTPSPPLSGLQFGGDLATPVGSLSSSSSVSQLTPRNEASPLLSPSDPFAGEGLEMLDELGDFGSLGGGRSLGSLESGEGGEEDWSRQGDPVETFLMDFEMDDVGGGPEESPADVSGGFGNVTGGLADVGGGFTDVRGSLAGSGASLAEVSGGRADLSGAARSGSCQIRGRTRKRPADVSVDVGEDPLGLRGAAFDHGRAAGGYGFQENVLRLYPAAVATSPEADSVLRGLAEGKAPKLGLEKGPGPLTQKLARVAQGFEVDEEFESCSKESELASEDGLLDQKWSEIEGFCKGSLTKGRVGSGLDYKKAPSSSLDDWSADVNSLAGELEAVTLRTTPGAFAPSMDQKKGALLGPGANGNGDLLLWGSRRAADPGGSDEVAPAVYKGAANFGDKGNGRESGSGVKKRMHELERRLGEAGERAQVQRRELEVAARVVSGPISQANADAILDTLQSEAVFEACARGGAPYQEVSQTVSKSARATLVQALCADGLSLQQRLTAAVLLGSYCGADPALAADALSCAGVIEGLVKLAYAQAPEVSKDILSEVHVIARHVLFQLAGCPPRGTTRSHGRHVVELLLRLVSTPDARSDASVGAGQPGSGTEADWQRNREAEAEARGAYQLGTVQDVNGAEVVKPGGTETAGNRALDLDVLRLGAGASSGVRLGALRALAWLAENVREAVDADALDVLLPLLRTESERNEILQPLVACLWHLTRSGHKPEGVAKRICASGEKEGLRRVKLEEGSAGGQGDSGPAQQDGTERVPASGTDGVDGSKVPTESPNGTEVQDFPTGLDSVLHLLRILLDSVPEEGVETWATIAPLVGVIVNVSTWASESRALIIRHRPDGIALLLDVLRTAQSAGAGHKSVDRTIRYVTMVLNALAGGKTSGLRVVETGGVELLVAGLQSGIPAVVRESTLALGALFHTCRDATKEALSRGGWAAREILPWSLGACVAEEEGDRGRAPGVEPGKAGKAVSKVGKIEEGGDQEGVSPVLEKIGSGSPGSVDSDLPRSVLALPPFESDVNGKGPGEDTLAREAGLKGVLNEGLSRTPVQCLS